MGLPPNIVLTCEPRKTSGVYGPSSRAAESLCAATALLDDQAHGTVFEMLDEDY